MASRQIWTLADLPTPAIELSTLRLQCRVDANDEDALLERYALAATIQVEKASQRVLVRRAAVLRVASLPSGRGGLNLPGGVVAEVTAMSVEGEPFTAFEVIGDSPAKIIPGTDWPVVTQDGFPVRVEYTVGPTSTPADLAVAVLMIAAEMYERRSEGSTGAAAVVPVSAASLINRRRILPR